MGIIVEFNPDLALRDWSEFQKKRRKKQECIPQKLQTGKIYDFLKKGHRNYWLMGECPLVKIKGQGNLSRPIASIIILEATHLLIKNEPYAKGKYKVIEIFDDDQIHFDGFTKI